MKDNEIVKALECCVDKRSMKKIVYTCDHCGKELDPMGDFGEYNIDVNGEYIDCDLCKGCLEELENLCRGAQCKRKGKG